ncbi:hypothetical protein BO78DRAFT_82133 [Aspergillus sclerotiicarbonarius CBS 121057]|uniref:Uncharacterized protein n=1 Tax=Aspergillus sclerotiicarbonarius (strain CBS 121057 / IBT 28362) TaxID=1448318 RepID=A0A319EEC8_ASPSB|nr:hypothetical protein BO78DRAFT_82133 [Aspergillus sclerotiicarbonarius CBS 121057]
MGLARGLSVGPPTTTIPVGLIIIMIIIFPFSISRPQEITGIHPDSVGMVVRASWLSYGFPTCGINHIAFPRPGSDTPCRTAPVSVEIMIAEVDASTPYNPTFSGYLCCTVVRHRFRWQSSQTKYPAGVDCDSNVWPRPGCLGLFCNAFHVLLLSVLA